MAQLLPSGSRKEKQPVSPITRACDMCRRKKIRCSVVSGGCVQCIKNQTPCHFTPISMTRAPRRSARDKRVEELELRLKSMEDLIKLPVSDHSFDATDVDSGNDSRGPNAPPFSNRTEAEISDLSIDLNAASTTAGKNSQPSDFGLSWPGAPFTAVASSQREFWPRALNFDDNGSVAIKTLPPKDRVLALVEKSFQGFYPAYPLFDKARFMSIFDSLDTGVNDPGQWACLNVVLALTDQFGHGTGEHTEEDCDTWGHFEAALAVVGQLMTRRVTLWSVQALLGMALVIQGTPNQGPVSLLVSAAMKLAHRIGLHRSCQDPNIGAAEIEERKWVFWIAYSLEKDLSLRMGQPSAQDDDDMDVELPYELDCSDMPPGGLTRINYFSFRARLAMIQGQIYKRLYSVKASKQDPSERVATATELEAMLRSWRESVPVEFLEDYHGHFLQPPIAGNTQPPLILQLLYFHSLTSVYRSSPALPMYRELRGTAQPLEFQLLSTPMIYANEARKAIRLLQVTPRRRYSCVWAVLYVFVTAATTLLKSIVHDPSNPIALSDLQLIEPLLTLLGVLAKSDKGRQSERIGGMHRSCMDLFEKANMAVESSNLANMDWDQYIVNSPSPGRGSVDGFLRRMEVVSSGDHLELDSIPPGASRDLAFSVEEHVQESKST